MLQIVFDLLYHLADLIHEKCTMSLIKVTVAVEK
jgi:hypothetical protein